MPRKTKLVEGQKVAIRRVYAERLLSYRELAMTFDVSHSTIRRVIIQGSEKNK